MWVREGERGWYGFLTYLERHPLYAGRWAPSSKLRPLNPEEIETFGRVAASRRQWRGY